MEAVSRMFSFRHLGGAIGRNAWANASGDVQLTDLTNRGELMHGEHVIEL